MLTFIKNERVLVIKQAEKTIVIPDLHLGFEREFSERGINIPSQTKKLLKRLEKIIRKHRPHRLIFLGDVKHGTSKILIHEWKEVPEFFESLLALVKKVEIVPGNHDGGLRPLLPKEVVVHPIKGVVLRDGRRVVYLTHGHAWPMVQAFASDILIMAHHHFTVELRDSSGLRMVEPVWVATGWNRREIAKSFLKTQGFHAKENPLLEFRRNFGFDIKELRIIVMPAFNPLLGGWAINSKGKKDGIGPLFKSGAIDMAGSEIYLLDGTFLGRLSNMSH